MNACFPYECWQVMPEVEVAARTIRLISHLVAAGEDPVGLVDDDFVPVVARQQISDLAYQAMDLGISSERQDWSLTAQGDLRIVFSFACETQASAFKLALL